MTATSKLDGPSLAGFSFLSEEFPRGISGTPFARPVSASVRSAASPNDNLDRRANRLTPFDRSLFANRGCLCVRACDGGRWKSLARLSLEVNEWLLV